MMQACGSGFVYNLNLSATIRNVSHAKVREPGFIGVDDVGAQTGFASH